jgi:hypothetical protein
MQNSYYHLDSNKKCKKYILITYRPKNMNNESYVTKESTYNKREVHIVTKESTCTKTTGITRSYIGKYKSSTLRNVESSRRFANIIKLSAKLRKYAQRWMGSTHSYEWEVKMFSFWKYTFMWSARKLTKSSRGKYKTMWVGSNLGKYTVPRNFELKNEPWQEVQYCNAAKYRLVRSRSTNI